MVHLFNNFAVKHAIVYACSASLVCTSLVGYQYPTEKFVVGFGDVNFAVQMEKLGEKLIKAANKGDLKKALKYLFEVKCEIESYTKTKINFNQQFDYVRDYFQQQKIKLSKSQWADMRYYMQGAHKKAMERHDYIADHFDGESCYLGDMAHEKAVNPMPPDDIPIRVTIGVTIALCGVFMLFVPFPICQVYAWRVIGAGATLAADGIMDRMSDNRKKEIACA